MTDLRILSYNTQGLQGIEKRLDILEYLKDKKSHIYCLQDIHFTEENEMNIKDQWGKSNCIFSNYKSNARGFAILFGKDIDYKIHTKITDDNGNYIILDLKIDNQKLTLVNLYGPNQDNPAFFQQISNYIGEIGNNIIMCGDYNCVINPDLDYYNYKHVNNEKARNKVPEIIDTKYLLDPFREKFPSLKKFTWQKRNPCKQARLDYFLISEKLMQYVKKTSTEPSYRSDHSPITFELNLTYFENGNSYWKHNNSLLTDLEYLKQINEKIIETKKQYALPVYNHDEIDSIPNREIQFMINDQLFLDTLLMEIRGKSMQALKINKEIVGRNI